MSFFIILFLLASTGIPSGVSASSTPNVPTNSQNRLTANTIIFSDDFSTEKGWVNESNGYIYRDATNQRLVWSTTRADRRRYYIPIAPQPGTNKLTLEYRFYITSFSGNGGATFGLVENLDAPVQLWEMDATGFFIRMSRFWEDGLSNWVNLAANYPDGSYYSAWNKKISFPQINTWLRVVVGLEGVNWTLSLYDNSGNLLGTSNGTMSQPFTSYNYLMLFHDYTNGWESASGYLDDITLSSSTSFSLNNITNVISVYDNFSDPEIITIPKGSTVIWINKSSTSHIITEGDPTYSSYLPYVRKFESPTLSTSTRIEELFPSHIPLFRSGINPGNSFEFTFNQEGIFKFYSEYAPNKITGEIHVVSPGEVLISYTNKNNPIIVETEKGAKLEVNAESVVEDTTASIIEFPAIDFAFGEYSSVGSAYDISISNKHSINGEMHITLPFDPEKIPSGISPDQVLVAYESGFGWNQIPGEVDFVNNTITFTTNHLSIYMPVYIPTAEGAADCRQYFLPEDLKFFDKGEMFIEKLYKSRDVFEQIQSSNKSPIFSLNYEAIRWLTYNRSLCQYLRLTQDDIYYHLGIRKTGSEVVQMIYELGKEVSNFETETGHENRLKILDLISNAYSFYSDASLGLNILRIGAAKVLPHAIVAELFTGLAKNIAYYINDIVYMEEMDKKAQELSIWLPSTFDVGVSNLPSISNRLDMWFYSTDNRTRCVLDYDYQQRFYKFSFSSSPDRVTAIGYANLFRDPWNHVYFVLGVQSAAQFYHPSLFDGGLADLLILLEYKDNYGKDNFKTIFLKNYRVRSALPECWYFVDWVDLPNITANSEIKVKYLFINDGHLDKGTRGEGYIYPINYNNGYLCYGNCSTIGNLHGKVVDATTNQPIPQAKICITNTSTCATTDNLGYYSLSGFRIGVYSFTITATNYITLQETINVFSDTPKDFALSPVLQNNEYRIVLTWGDSPRDLDSHLWLPNSQPYHIYYGDKGNETQFPYAKLDIDDTDGLGPETITIKRLYPGTYRYAVYNYSLSPSIRVSNAKVEVYSSQGLIKRYTLPSSGDGTWWYVFKIENGVFVDVNLLSSISPAPY